MHQEAACESMQLLAVVLSPSSSSLWWMGHTVTDAGSSTAGSSLLLLKQESCLAVPRKLTTAVQHWSDVPDLQQTQPNQAMLSASLLVQAHYCSCKWCVVLCAAVHLVQPDPSLHHAEQLPPAAVDKLHVAAAD